MLKVVRNAIELLQHISCNQSAISSILLFLLSVLDCSLKLTTFAVFHHKAFERARIITIQEPNDVNMIECRQQGCFFSKQLYLILIVGGSFLDRLDSHQLSR